MDNICLEGRYMMNYYVENENDDVGVQNHQELPKNWLKWGIVPQEGFAASNESFMVDSSSSLHPSASGSDCQIDTFEETAWMDDLFLNLLGDEPQTGDYNDQCGYSAESTMLADQFATEMNSFSPSTGWEEEQVSGWPFNLDQLYPKDYSMVAQFSHEESVLNDLENVMAKLNDNTRICFRDAFYRLSKNSDQGQSGEFVSQVPQSTQKSQDEKRRSGKKKAIESETNCIDRAISKLTFNQMDTKARDFSSQSNQRVVYEIIDG